MKNVATLFVWVISISVLLLGKNWAQQVPASAPDETPAQETVKDKNGGVTNSEIRRVLRDLEADELAIRDAAEKRLVELGPTVMPFLPQVTPRTSGELKVRLQRIRQALQQTNIETFFEASTVTLKGAMELSEAIEAIQQQTGNVIELQTQEGSSSTQIELDCEDEPFWSVIAKIMAQAKLRINAFGTTESNLVLSPGGGDQSRVLFDSGPFHIEVVSVQTRRIFNSQFEGQLDLSFQMAWEPRLKPVFLQIPMSTVSATVDGDKQLAPLNEQASPEIPLNLGGCTTQVDLQLERPERGIQKIDLLKGEVVIAVPGDRHQYVFEKFGNGARQRQKFGDVAVTLEGARNNGAVYEMRVMVEFGDAQGALESFRGWILSNEAYLLDANQRRLENVGLNTYAVRNNGVGIAYLFQINADPDEYKLIYESPAAISKQRIPYELKDIALP